MARLWRRKSVPAPPQKRLSVKDILLAQGRHSEPELSPLSPPPPPLPVRPWHKPPEQPFQPPPSVIRTPDIPPKREPDIPLPPPPIAEESPPPARPPKPSPTTLSPKGLSWYHAGLDRKKAEIRLKKYSRDGTFIIRDSTKVPGEFSLSLWFGGGIRHLRIRLRSDKKYVLGEEKEDELPFDTVMDLVAYHKRDPLVLKSGGETTLKFECPQ